MRSYEYDIDKNALQRSRKIELSSQFIGFNAEGILYQNAQNTTYKANQLQNCNTTGPNVIDMRCVSMFQNGYNHSSFYPFPTSLTPPSPGKPLKLNSGVCQGLRNYNVTMQQDDLYLAYCATINVTTLSNYFQNFIGLVNQSFIIQPGSWVILYNSQSQVSHIDFFSQTEIQTNQNKQEAVDLNNTINSKYSNWTYSTSLKSNLIDMLNTQESLIVQQNYARNGTKVIAMINPIIVYDKLPQFVGVKSYQPKGINTNILYFQINFITDQFLQESALQLLQKFDNYFLIASIVQLCFFSVSLLIAIHYTIRLNRLFEQPLVQITKFLTQMLEELKTNELFDVYNTNNLNVKEMLRSEEISLLYKTLEQTFQLLIKTTDNFFSENPTNTLIRLFRNIQFFNQFRNNHAVGIIHNSLGIILMSQDHYFRALKHFSASILFAQYEIQDYFIQNGFSNEMIPFFCFHDENINKKSFPSQANRNSNVSNRANESSLNKRVTGDSSGKNNQKPKLSSFQCTKTIKSDTKNNENIQFSNQKIEENQIIEGHLQNSSPLCHTKNNNYKRNVNQQKQHLEEQMQLPLIFENHNLENIHSSLIESNHCYSDSQKDRIPSTPNSHKQQDDQHLNDSSENQKYGLQNEKYKPNCEELNNLYLNVYYRKKNYAITLIQFQEYQQKNLKQISSLYNIQFNFWREIKSLLKELIAMINYIEIHDHEVIELLTLISKCQLNLKKTRHAKTILHQCQSIGSNLQAHLNQSLEKQDLHESVSFHKVIFERNKAGNRVTLYNQYQGLSHQQQTKLKQSNILTVGRETHLSIGKDTPLSIGKETPLYRKRNISKYSNLSSSQRILNRKKQETSYNNNNNTTPGLKQSLTKQKSYDHLKQKVGVIKRLDMYWKKFTNMVLRRKNPEDGKATNFTILSQQQDLKNVECDTSNNEICRLEETFENMRKLVSQQSNMDVGDHFIQTVKLAFAEYYVFTREFSEAAKIILEEFENNFTMYSYLPFQMTEMLEKMLSISQIEDSYFDQMTQKFNFDISMRVNIVIGNIESSQSSCIETLNLISNLANQTLIKPNDLISILIYNIGEDIPEAYMELLKVQQIRSYISYFIQDIYRIIQGNINNLDYSFTDRSNNQVQLPTKMNISQSQFNNITFYQQDVSALPIHNKGIQLNFPNSKRALNYLTNQIHSPLPINKLLINRKQKNSDTQLYQRDILTLGKLKSNSLYNNDMCSISTHEQILSTAAIDKTKGRLIKFEYPSPTPNDLLSNNHPQSQITFIKHSSSETFKSPLVLHQTKSQNNPSYDFFDQKHKQNHNDKKDNQYITENYSDTKIPKQIQQLSAENKESPLMQLDSSWNSQKFSKYNNNCSDYDYYVNNNDLQKGGIDFIEQSKEDSIIQQRSFIQKCQENEGDQDDLLGQQLNESYDRQNKNEYIFHISMRFTLLKFKQNQQSLKLFLNPLSQEKQKITSKRDYINCVVEECELFQRRKENRNFIIYITNQFCAQKNTLFFKLVESLFSLNITLLVLSYSRGNNFIELLDEATYIFKDKELIKIFYSIQSIETFLTNQRSNITKHIYPTYVQNF